MELWQVGRDPAARRSTVHATFRRGKDTGKVAKKGVEKVVATAIVNNWLVEDAEVFTAFVTAVLAPQLLPSAGGLRFLTECIRDWSRVETLSADVNARLGMVETAVAILEDQPAVPLASALLPQFVELRDVLQAVQVVTMNTCETVVAALREVDEELRLMTVVHIVVPSLIDALSASPDSPIVRNSTSTPPHAPATPTYAPSSRASPSHTPPSHAQPLCATSITPPPAPASPSPAPASPSPAPASPSSAPASPSSTPASLSSAPGSPSHAPGSPSPAPASHTPPSHAQPLCATSITPPPARASPSSAPASPSSTPASLSSAPGSPSHAPRSPSPAPGSPSPAPASHTPPSHAQPLCATSHTPPHAPASPSHTVFPLGPPTATTPSPPPCPMPATLYAPATPPYAPATPPYAPATPPYAPVTPPLAPASPPSHAPATPPHVPTASPPATSTSQPVLRARAPTSPRKRAATFGRFLFRTGAEAGVGALPDESSGATMPRQSRFMGFARRLFSGRGVDSS
ncbi:hypothetical protein C8R47DRAFT_393918 [Mycena vitilis]|nr:hypothetical protein C8R47DRAFT_393918 [Mycena vitilis]